MHKPVAVDRAPWSYLAWQFAVLALACLITLGVVWEGALDRIGHATAASLTLLAFATFLAGVIPWDRVRPTWRLNVPIISLAAIALLGVEVLPLMPSAALVAIVPVAWLVFEFGRLGTGISLVGLVAMLALIYRGEPFRPYDGPDLLTFAPLAVGAVGLLLGTHQIAGRLRTREQALLEQSRRLQETLDVSRDRMLLLQAVLETVDAAVIAFDSEGRMLLQNNTAYELGERFGMRADGQVEPSFEMYFEDRVTPVPHDDLMLHQLLRGESPEPATYWLGPPGDQIAQLVSGQHIYRGDHDRYGFVIVGLDITDVLEAVRVRDEFLTTVSHELRTPLTSIMGYHELIEDALGPDEQQVLPMLQVAQRNATVLLSRVGQLLQASGSPAEVSIEPQRLDISTLVRTALTKHHVALQAAGLKLVTRVEDGIHADVDCCAWEQVVDNLVSNAVKYTPSGGSVQVELDQDPETVTMRVSDTGVGMSWVEQRRAFERFYRASSATEQAVQGLGVGLSVVQTMVEAHGGWVELTSAVEVGTQVVVRVPRAAAVG